MGSVHVDTVQGYVEVSGVISTDTMWTKVDGPYNLTGNILVNNGVTLTIQSETTVNLNSYYIMVNGTLTAKGGSNDRIYFNGGQITFTEYSTGWNEQTRSGCIIQYAIISGFFTTGGAIIINGGSPAIINNDMNVTIGITGGSPIISGNTITGVQYATFSGGSRYAQHAIYIDYEMFSSGAPIISDNTISGGFDDACISVGGGSPIIQRNLISGGHVGIDIDTISSYNSIIENNTIASCYRGISVSGSETAVTFTYNNLEGISNFTVYNWRTANNLNAANNWWGTTNTTEIDRKIWDYNDDFNLGKVNYTPFLTEQNPQAMPDPNASLPDQDGNSNMPQTDFYGIIIIALVVIIVITLLAVGVFILRKKKQNP